jgi:Domain of unknown function (DUF6285)
MQDRPTVAELLDAVRGFLEHGAVEALEGTAKFHARVAANVLAIALRELEMEPALLAAEWKRLDALLGAAAAPPDLVALRDGVRSRTEALCERIRRGDADAGRFRADVLAHVRATVREKLAIVNPRLLAAEEAEP